MQFCFHAKLWHTFLNFQHRHELKKVVKRNIQTFAFQTIWDSSKALSIEYVSVFEYLISYTWSYKAYLCPPAAYLVRDCCPLSLNGFTSFPLPFLLCVKKSLLICITKYLTINNIILNSDISGEQTENHEPRRERDFKDYDDTYSKIAFIAFIQSTGRQAAKINKILAFHLLPLLQFPTIWCQSWTVFLLGDYSKKRQEAQANHLLFITYHFEMTQDAISAASALQVLESSKRLWKQSSSRGRIKPKYQTSGWHITRIRNVFMAPLFQEKKENSFLSVRTRCTLMIY